ncbi:MAG TPA: NEW3 domain-containing protein [Candidatus Limnocylindrales bacterium]|nr:NEW3 domain-containing protein [Candidatus Limnocylindrales bacterium]
MRRIRLASLLLATSLVGFTAVAPVAVLAASPTLTTPYPSVTVNPGSSVSFDLTLDTTTAQLMTVDVSSVPSGWTTSLTGNGTVVDSVYTDPGKPPALNLSVNVPADATAGTQGITVTARGPSGTATLPLKVRVETQASGGATMTTSFPKLSGTPTDTFNFSLTLTNNTSQKQTFSLQGQGPDGWKVTVNPSGNTQALTDEIDAGANDTLTATVTPPSTAEAGSFPVTVTAAAGSLTAKVDLQVTITGSPSLSVSTPNQVLNATVTSGSTGTVSVIVTNTGTSPLTDVSLTSTPPSGWTVTFAPSSIATIKPNASETVTATIHPGDNALAGDYDLTITATSGSASDDIDIRTTIQTSPLWGFVGIAIIVIVLIGLAWVFRRYGRR